MKKWLLALIVFILAYAFIAPAFDFAIAIGIVLITVALYIVFTIVSIRINRKKDPI